MARRTIREGPTRQTNLTELEQEARRLRARSRSTQTPRPVPNVSGDGLKVGMHAVKGLTDPDVLRVPFYFQVPPMESFSRSAGYSHTEYDTLRRGQFSRPGGRTLRTIQFQSMFVDWDADWTVVHPTTNYLQMTPVRDLSKPGGVADAVPTPAIHRPNPVELAAELQEILWSGTPFLLTAHQMGYWGHGVWDVKMNATLRDLSVEERAGEIDTRYVDVSFTEYREPELTRRGYRVRNRGRKLPSVFTIDDEGAWRDRHGQRVVSGQTEVTLHRLAEFYYGESSEWKRIARANGLRNWPGSRALKLLAAKRKGDVLKLRIPEPPEKEKEK